jgi:DNA-binding XRE family transcriptional regulator
VNGGSLLISTNCGAEENCVGACLTAQGTAAWAGYRMGRRVHTLRDKKGWSQERLAEHADLDRSYIAGTEVGARNPSLKALERLADGLSVSLSELFGQ